MIELPVADAVTDIIGRGNRVFPDRELQRRHDQAILSAVRGARRYFFDEASTRAASELGTRHPERLERLLERARAPFDRVLIDYSVRGFIQGGSPGREPAEGAPARAAMYVERIHGSRYRAVSIVASLGIAILNPVETIYDLDDYVGDDADWKWLVDTAWRSVHRSGIQARANGGWMEVSTDFSWDRQEYTVRSTLLGATVGCGPDQDDFLAHARISLTQPTAAFMRANGHEPQIENVISESLFEYAGQWRLLVTMLGLLQAQDFVSETPWKAGAGRRIAGGKVHGYTEHRRVSLKLPRHVVVRKAAERAAEGLPKRRHEVAGHWRHRHSLGDPSCTHAFEATASNPTTGYVRQVCTGCQYTRWFVPDFERGDARLGYVTKDRVVSSTRGSVA